MSNRTRLWVPFLLAALAVGCSCKNPKPGAKAAPSAQVAPALAGSKVDSLLKATWQAQGVLPTAAADDRTFIRRATLDMLGVLPTPEEVQTFVADAGADKRARLMDRLLADNRFSERFAAVYTDLLLGESGPKKDVDRAAFRGWLRDQMAARAGWNTIAHEVVAGTGKNSPGGAVRDRLIAAAATVAPKNDDDVHGNVNYMVRFRGAVEDLAGRTSRNFLGVQIQCAQCHDHKTEAWTTAQFKSFAASFIQTRAVPVDDKEKGEVRVLELKDMPKVKLGPKATESQRAIAEAPPRALDGTQLDTRDRRRALADWMVAKQNPTFAKAFVNRTWAHLLGTGFVEPVDDFRPGNKPDLPELLEALADGFVASGYDIRGLYKTICLSEAYQRSAGPPAKLWASFSVRPIGAEVLFDAVVYATGLGPLVEEIAGERAELVRARAKQRFVLVLDVDEDAGTHSFEGSIPHALLLSNGAVTRMGARAIEGGSLLAILRDKGDDNSKLDALYERTLSRKPTQEEREHWKTFLADSMLIKDDAQGKPLNAGRPKDDMLAKLEKRLPSKAKTPKEKAFEDIFWALLNSSEMAMQH
ncbi:MAG: DUF1549 domain-containing protein [Polyangiaceae bacterium]|nr:DUF1549 domain-containing protein [Polyangiaceae bacterium]